MSRIPRLLPLIAVAIVGVLGINLLAGAKSLPDMLSAARAFAEGAAPAPKAKVETKAEAVPVEKAASALPPGFGDVKTPAQAADAEAQAAAAATPGAGTVCLAREAGMSPAEMQMIQDLGARRTQIEAREGDVDVQLKLLEAAEKKLDAKIATLNGLKGDITNLLGQVDEKQAAEIARLVKVYSSMKPQQAATAMATLNDEVRLPIAATMKETALAAILNKMSTPAAKDLTEKLAERMSSAKQLDQARQAVATPAAAAAPTKTAAAPAPAAKPKTG